MNKEFVPYELAVKLKQLGFDEPCLTYYNYDKKIEKSDDWAYGVTLKDKRDRNECLAPLFQQAFRWFRENYLYYPHFFSKEDGTFVWCIRWYIDGLQKDTPYFSSNTYEEAELACLDKLIEIVTKQQEQ